MTWTDPFNKQFFFFTLNPPRWVPSCHDRPKIKNTNYKHTNFRFMIFRPKIINTDTNPNMNSKITNKNFKFMIFPFKIRNTNTNFRFMIFPFKITNTNTNTNTNSHDWDELNPEKEKEKKMENEVEQGRERVVERGREGGRLSEAVRGWLTSRVSVRDGWGIWPYGLCEMGEGDERVVQDRRGRTRDERVRELCLTACGYVSERVKRWRESLEDVYT